MNEEVITIQEILETLKKHCKLIFSITLIVTILSAIISFFIIPPKYETSIKLFIGKEGSVSKDIDKNYSDNDVEMYQKLLKTYGEVIKTKDLVENAVNLENVGIKSKDVLKNLEVTPTLDTQILEIKYTNQDKVLATNILDLITKEFIKEAEQLIPNGNIKIIESVKAPEKPVSPNKELNIAIAFLLGLVVSVGLSFFLEYIDNTFDNRERLEEVLKLPVLGIVPDFLNSLKKTKYRDNTKKIKIRKKNKKNLSKGQNTNFTLEDNPKCVVTEAYKTLRTNIQYSSFDKEIKTIVITSAEIAEGKSTVSKNIALTFAQSEKKVMLVDCDLRKPSVHVNFKVSNLIGISEVLLGKAKIEEAVQKHNENLYFLTSGKIPPNPSEMLASSAMTNLIETLKEEYDIVILDTAPLIAVTDAQILSTKVDGTILVVRASKTKKDAVIDGKNLLGKVGANIIGTVLYAVESKRGKYYYYYGSEA